MHELWDYGLVLEQQWVIWKSLERIEESCSKILSHFAIDKTAFSRKYQKKKALWVAIEELLAKHDAGLVYMSLDHKQNP